MLNEKMMKLGSERSAIRELFEKGKVLKQKFGDENVFDFSIGNPSVPCPKELNDTIINMLTVSNFLDTYDETEYDTLDIDFNPNENFDETKNSYKLQKLNSAMLHGYTSAAGDLGVRREISQFLKKKYNASVNENLMYMTTGAAAALTITIKAITDGSEEDEIIVFTPYFPEYKVFIENANAKIVTVKSDLKNFYPDLIDFENKITKNTKAIIINSPNNPTGVLFKEDIIKKIVDVLNKKQNEFNENIYIISDEPYRELIWTDDKYPFITNYYVNSIITYSFSKSLSLPGERIGYIAVCDKMRNANDVYTAILGAGRSLGYVCANSLFQHLIPHCLDMKPDIDIYKNNANLLLKELCRIGYEVIKPDGAFYLFMKALEDDDKKFSLKALEYNLLLVPSESFGITGFVRIAYCVKEKMILKSLDAFKKLYESYKKE